MIQTADGLHHSAGAQVGAADAGDQQHVGIRTDLLGCLLDAGELLLVISNRQVKPAQEIIAETGLGFQLFMGQLDLRINCLIFFRTDKFCQMFAIKFDSHRMLLLYVLIVFMIPFCVGIVKQMPGIFFDFFMNIAQIIGRTKPDSAPKARSNTQNSTPLRPVLP